jgi:hypothetical protein
MVIGDRPLWNNKSPIWVGRQALRHLELNMSLPHEFDHIAKRLWSMDHDTARLVAQLSAKDRQRIEQCLRSLYGASVHLDGSETEIREAIEKLRR